MSEICKSCHMHKVLGEKCWYFWENKKACSQFRKDESSEPGFGSIDKEN
ncbi:MAG: hypothetical protein AABY01_00265 [Nanoarchaeota archaeon]